MRYAPATEFPAVAGTILEDYVGRDGYLPLDGSVLAKADYPLLAAQIGDGNLTYEGNPITLASSASPFYSNYPADSGYAFDLQSDGTSFLYTNGYFIFQSPDGMKWKPVAVAPVGLTYQNQIRKLKYRAGVWFAYGEPGARNFGYLTSTDGGATWTEVRLSFGFSDMTYDGTNYLFVYGTTSWFGSDLSALTVGTIGAASYVCEKIGTSWLAWANSTNTSIYRSTNGTTWATQSIGQTQSFMYSIANGYLFIMRYVDASSRPIYVATNDGTTWTASGTSAGGASDYWSRTAVVYDGTTYACGYLNSTASKIYTFTTVNGAATALNCTDAYQCYYAPNLLAYKTGKFVFVSDYYGRDLYVTTAAPAANWDYHASYASGTCIPFYPVAEYLTVSSNMQYRGLVAVSNYNIAGSTNHRLSVFLEDASGHFEPYILDGAYLNNYGTTPHQNLALGLSHGGALAYVRYLDGGSGTYYTKSFAVNRTAKTLANINTASSSTTAKNAFFSTPYGTVETHSASTSTFDGFNAYVTDASIPGYGTAFTGAYGSSYNPNNGVMIFTGVHSTSTYCAKVSRDHGLSFNEVVPKLYSTALAAVTLNSSFIAWHTGKEYRLLFGGTVYRGAALDYMVADPAVTMPTYAQYAAVLVLDEERYAYAGKLKYHNNGWVAVGETSFARSATTIAYDFDFGTVFVGVPSGNNAPLVSSYTNLAGTPTSTHFKLSNIAPATNNKTVFVATGQ